MDILFADDDFNTYRDRYEEHPYYEALEYALRKKGQTNISIDVASSGVNTYAKLRENQYDSIILDIMMSLGNEEILPSFLVGKPSHRVGLVIAEQISEKAEGIHIPQKILILTASAVAKDHEELKKLCVKNNNWDFMKKPVLFDDITSFLLGGKNA